MATTGAKGRSAARAWSAFGGEASSRTRALTLGMVAAALLAVEIGAAEVDGPRGWIAAKWTLLFAATAAASVWDARRFGPGEGRRKRPERPDAAALGVFVGFATVPVLADLAFATSWTRLTLLETATVLAARNLMLGLAAVAGWASSRNLCAVVSLFLTMVSASRSDDPAALAAGLAFLGAGVPWLVSAHWDGTRARMTAAAATAARRGAGATAAAGSEGRWPWGAAVGAALLLAIPPAVLWMGPQRAASILGEWVRASGGTSIADEFAEGGVNDGPNEVSGSEDPRSTGFTQSEQYLETERDSLYDAFNDMYGEPFKPKTRERMMSIAPGDIKESREGPKENLQASREFALLRRKPAKDRMTDRPATALLEVSGRTPIHMRMTSYAEFDGRNWVEEAADKRTRPTHPVEEGSPWFESTIGNLPVFAGPESHRIKIGRLKATAVPTPNHVEMFRVGSLNVPEFFLGNRNGVVRMIRTIPAGTVVDTVCRTIDPDRLRRHATATGSSAVGTGATEYLRPTTRADGATGEGPASVSEAADEDEASEEAGIDPRIPELAREWAGGAPPGFGAVERIAEGLRNHARLERGLSPPEGTADPLAWFLFESRAGDDYLFASAAVVMLRSLGYPSRLAAGYYADPARYDRRTRHTPVDETDLHFWAEVYANGTDWLIVEATPGYERLPANRGWLAAAAESIRLLAARARERRAALGIAVMLAVLGVIQRHRLADGALRLWWSARARRTNDARRLIGLTLATLERRARWTGRGRPPGRTTRRWLEDLAGLGGAEAAATLRGWARGLDQALYAPRRVAIPLEPAREQCRLVVERWTYPYLRDRIEGREE